MKIEEILAKAARPETTVSLCLAGPLVAEYERLEHGFRNASTVAMSLGDRAPAAEIAEQMNAVRSQMLEAEVPLLLRALPPRDWDAFASTMPGPAETDEERATFDDRYFLWVCQLVALTCVDPEMNADQVDQLVQQLSGAQWSQLSNAAYGINTKRQAIPFSVAASATHSSTVENSRLPAPGVSPAVDGSEPSGDQ